MIRRMLVVLLAAAALTLLGARPSLQGLQMQVDDIGGREVAQAFSPLDTSTPKSITVDCPAGKVAVGGGGKLNFELGTGSTGHALGNSYPSSDTSWSVFAVAPDTSQNDWQLVGYVVCVAL